MNTESDLWFLEQVNLYEFLCPNKMGNHESPEESKYRKGDFIYFPNQPSEKIYLVSKGRVKIGTYSDEGKEVIKGIIGKGDIFGELALAGQEKRHDFAQAIEPTEICSLKLDEIMSLMQKSTGFSLKITRAIGEKLVETERRLESLVFKDARARIVDFLRDVGHKEGRKVGDETLIDNFLTHKEISNLTGTSRQTVTTILNELREENQIYFDRKRVLIRNIDTLA